jgi:hypothetical protein
VEVLSYSVYEHLRKDFHSVDFLHISHDLSHLITSDQVLIFSLHQVGNFTSVEQVVDVFEETFVEDLVIGEDEGDLLGVDT